MPRPGVKKEKNLTVREKKFVKAKIEGKTNVQAYNEAGYSPMKPESERAVAGKINTKPHIQKAIDDALEKHGATPEWAVKQLMRVAEQDKEVGAKRLASKDLLELHGWNKSERPTMTLDIKNAFFGTGRDDTKIIDQEER